jgi:hypothetical protein
VHVPDDVQSPQALIHLSVRNTYTCSFFWLCLTCHGRRVRIHTARALQRTEGRASGDTTQWGVPGVSTDIEMFPDDGLSAITLCNADDQTATSQEVALMIVDVALGTKSELATNSLSASSSFLALRSLTRIFKTKPNPSSRARIQGLDPPSTLSLEPMLLPPTARSLRVVHALYGEQHTVVPCSTCSLPWPRSTRTHSMRHDRASGALTAASPRRQDVQADEPLLRRLWCGHEPVRVAYGREGVCRSRSRWSLARTWDGHELGRLACGQSRERAGARVIMVPVCRRVTVSRMIIGLLMYSMCLSYSCLRVRSAPTFSAQFSAP